MDAFESFSGIDIYSVTAFGFYMTDLPNIKGVVVILKWIMFSSPRARGRDVSAPLRHTQLTHIQTQTHTHTHTDTDTHTHKYTDTSI